MPDILAELEQICRDVPDKWTFESRCHSAAIIIESLPDGSVIAYRSDDRSERVEVDMKLKPFDKLVSLK